MGSEMCIRDRGDVDALEIERGEVADLQGLVAERDFLARGPA